MQSWDKLTPAEKAEKCREVARSYQRQDHPNRIKILDCAARYEAAAEKLKAECANGAGSR